MITQRLVKSLHSALITNYFQLYDYEIQLHDYELSNCLVTDNIIRSWQFFCAGDGRMDEQI